MSDPWGVWSDSAGGVISAGAWSPEEAERDRQSEIANHEGESEDLRIIRLCADHEEQPFDSCEECYDE